MFKAQDDIRLGLKRVTIFINHVSINQGHSVFFLCGSNPKDKEKQNLTVRRLEMQVGRIAVHISGEYIDCCSQKVMLKIKKKKIESYQPRVLSGNGNVCNNFYCKSFVFLFLSPCVTV